MGFERKLMGFNYIFHADLLTKNHSQWVDWFVGKISTGNHAFPQEILLTQSSPLIGSSQEFKQMPRAGFD